MAEKSDMDLFLEALDNLPEDIISAKFDGVTSPCKPESKHSACSAFDATVDLHGYTKTEALIALRALLTRTKGKKRRLLVITGKGLNSEDGRGVVREAVYAYLQSAGSLFVREFGFASPKNGGDGAIEILTK